MTTIIGINENFHGILKEERKKKKNVKWERAHKILISVGGGGKFHLKIKFHLFLHAWFFHKKKKITLEQMFPGRKSKLQTKVQRKTSAIFLLFYYYKTCAERRALHARSMNKWFEVCPARAYVGKAPLWSDGCAEHGSA